MSCLASQALSEECAKLKQYLEASQSNLASSAQKQAAADKMHQQALAHEQQCSAALAQALEQLTDLLMTCLAAMAAAAAAAAPPPVEQQRIQQQQFESAAEADSADVAEVSGGVPAAAAALATLVALTRDELADLLGPEDETCQLLVGSGGLDAAVANDSHACLTPAGALSSSNSTLCSRSNSSGSGNNQLSWSEAWQQRQQKLQQELAAPLQQFFASHGSSSSNSTQSIEQQWWQGFAIDIKHFLRHCSEEVALKKAQLQQVVMCTRPICGGTA
jgi:hypothetical protein